MGGGGGDEAALFEPSPVVALAREVYATVRLRSACAAETTGLTRSAERVSLADAFFREGSDGMTKHPLALDLPN